jgi:3,4-dihydroxy-9,10-secoandrosta-1,3,5(10)-triene-9,17-dione 4,5-dioxygenase
MSSAAPAYLDASTAGKVRALGYVGLTAPDLDAWERFGTEVVGLQVAPESTVQKLLFRADERAWRLSVVPGDGQVAHIGWEVSGPRDLEEVALAMESAGIPVTHDPDTARERQVSGLFRAKDPAGIVLEFFYGAKVSSEPFLSPRGAQFVTGEMGLGHVVLMVPDVEAARGFYLDTLGFRISDRVVTRDASVLFTHVNPRHHTLALWEAKHAVGLHHVMLEVSELDSVGRALDQVLAGGAQLTSTLGKHLNDRMTSFYCRTPSHCELEYGWNGRRIDDATWVTAEYDSAHLWGHARVPGAPPDEDG